MAELPREGMQSECSSFQGLYEMIVRNSLASFALCAFARLRLAEALSSPRSLSTVATEFGYQTHALRVILDSVVELGAVSRSADGAYSLSPRGRCLLASDPQSIAGIARYWGSPLHVAALARLDQSVLDGASSHFHAHGETFYETLEADPSSAGLFQDALASFCAIEATELLELYDFSRESCVVDVAGGYGHLLVQILNRHDTPLGVLFDTPRVISLASQRPELQALGDRLRLCAGDFFKQVDSAGSCFVLKSALMDWPDARAVEILAVLRQAVPPSGVLLLCERMPRSQNESQVFGLEMLAVGGHLRTEDDHRALLRAAGFAVSETVYGERLTLIVARRSAEAPN